MTITKPQSEVTSKKRISIFQKALLVAALVAGIPATGSAQTWPGALIGNWMNVNAATRDIVNASVTDVGNGNVRIQLFGACSPNPCPWAVVPAAPYTANVNSREAVAFTAYVNTNFSRAMVIGHIQGMYLILEVFTTFTDGSGRAAYYSTNTMRR